MLLYYKSNKIKIIILLYNKKYFFIFKKPFILNYL